MPFICYSSLQHSLILELSWLTPSLSQFSLQMLPWSPCQLRSNRIQHTTVSHHPSSVLFFVQHHLHLTEEFICCQSLHSTKSEPWVYCWGLGTLHHPAHGFTVTTEEGMAERRSIERLSCGARCEIMGTWPRECGWSGAGGIFERYPGKKANTLWRWAAGGIRMPSRSLICTARWKMILFHPKGH